MVDIAVVLSASIAALAIAIVVVWCSCRHCQCRHSKEEGFISETSRLQDAIESKRIEEEKKIREREEGISLTACRFFLRDRPFRFVKYALDIGNPAARRFKSHYELQDAVSGASALATVIRIPRSFERQFRSPSSSSAKKPLLNGFDEQLLPIDTLEELLSHLDHPCIFPCDASGFLPESGRVVLIRSWSPRGSLRDLLHKCQPALPYSTKYESEPIRNRPLPDPQVALFGRQILEGIRSLQQMGIGPLWHLTCTNIIVEEGMCRLYDVVENALLGLPPSSPLCYCHRFGDMSFKKLDSSSNPNPTASSKSDSSTLPWIASAPVEIICFAEIFVEMLCGKVLRSLDIPPPFYHDLLRVVDDEIQKVLRVLFEPPPNSSESNSLSVDILCALPFFEKVRFQFSPDLNSEYLRLSENEREFIRRSHHLPFQSSL